MGIAAGPTAIEYEYRFTEYRFAEYEYDEIRSEERTAGITEHEELTQRKSKRPTECFVCMPLFVYVLIISSRHTNHLWKELPEKLLLR
jgi:hypothetical protein